VVGDRLFEGDCELLVSAQWFVTERLQQTQLSVF